MRFPSLLLSLGLAAALHAAPAAAETTRCTVISSLPATLTTQGVYCLKQDLATAITGGTAILVATNNVTIDCNGFKVGGLAAGPGTSTNGIATQAERLNTTVRGCNVRGFRAGIYLQGDGHLVEDNRLDSTTSIGVIVAGDGSVVRGNRVYDTGGSTMPWPTIGIYAMASVEVTDNTVSGVLAEATDQPGYGIYSNGNLQGVVARNRVRHVRGNGAGMTIGIYAQASGALSLRDNVVAYPLASPGWGIACGSSQTVASGNHVLGFSAGLLGCHSGAENVIK